MRKGEILGVVGGSGTGKSVLMRSIIGLQTPVEGEVEVLGEPMVGMSDEDTLALRKRWGIMFQGGALFSTLTVAENVQVPLARILSAARQAVSRQLGRVQDPAGGICLRMPAPNIRPSYRAG